MSIEIVSDLFKNIPQERRRLTNLIRKEIFEAYAKNDEYGMVFTFMWALDEVSDWDYINKLESLFVSHGAEVYYVELEADYDVRIERNKSENRLLNKPSKRNLEHSEELFKRLESTYRLNSKDDEIRKDNYIKINNTNRPPDEVAAEIRKRFSL